jgi:hypothetical protein
VDSVRASVTPAAVVDDVSVPFARTRALPDARSDAVAALAEVFAVATSPCCTSARATDGARATEPVRIAGSATWRRNFATNEADDLVMAAPWDGGVDPTLSDD